MASIAKFPLHKVVPYVLAQLFGALFGSGLAYLGHYRSFMKMNGNYNSTSKLPININCTAVAISNILTTCPKKHMDTISLFADGVN